MALQNGVLVHGPTAWGCAVRDENGDLRVASGRKPRFAPALRQRLPVLRGPVALAEAFALLPTVRRAIPQARFPFERPSVLGAMLGTAVAARVLRRSKLPAGTREIAAAGVAFLPAALALRGPNLAAYHGAEHIAIGTYENGGTPAPKEHPRCGSQLIAPMVASSLTANVLAAKAPAGTARITTIDSPPLKDIVAEMTQKRLGMTAVIDATGRLVGIITDGDLRRLHLRAGLIGEFRARDFMTAEPRLVDRDALAATALDLMEQGGPITCLVVVDAAHRPQGVLHLHDILRAKIDI